VIGQINHDPDFSDQRNRRHVSIVYIFGVLVNSGHIEPIEVGSVRSTPGRSDPKHSRNWTTSVFAIRGHGLTLGHAKRRNPIAAAVGFQVIW
jgi:hypothetical protein